ncbi:MAG TPA: dihydrofolate reductase, partial [Flavobacteriales bacterium]|nr:dihydrofolate reductase [Flavobacteriales bacterium]
MKYWTLASILALSILSACAPAEQKEESTEMAEAQPTDEFEYLAEQFADLKIIRYQVPGFDKLSLDQKKLAYYLYQVSLAGRDIIWDQNYRHNLSIRKALEHIVSNYEGDKTTKDWENFMVYTKRVWFANGIHHHYGMTKFTPEFSQDYFKSLMEATSTEVSDEVLSAIFDPAVDAKRVNLDPKKDLVQASANNFYDPSITEAEVDAYYAEKIDKTSATPVSYGLNSKLVKRDDGSLQEVPWKVGGMYGAAIEEMVSWLEKAVTVAESEDQRKGFELLIEFYKTGDLKTWDDYSIQWTKTTGDVLDYINGFIEVYGDSKGFRGTYESIIQMEDFDASARMKVVADNVQWFEDNSSILDEHKKASVTGVTYKVVNAIMEAGDASPSTPIGVNLPNANWIRANHGSKSVSLGNIVEAYSQAGGKSMLKEFTLTEEEFNRSDEHGKLASKLHTALHEVVGHAS